MKKKSSLKHTGAFWAFCAPCCILFGVFFLVPLVLSIAFSFTNYDGWKTIDFVGLTNYITLFKDSKFYLSLGRTLLYTVCTLPFRVIIPLLVAVLLCSNRVAAKSLTRTMVYIPVLMSALVVGITINWMFSQEYGFVNFIIRSLGGTALEWSLNPRLATFVIAFASVWASIGFNMILYIGGINSISNDLYEAATIDGASGVQAFFRITVPMLAPTTFMVVLLSTVNLLKEYALVQGITQGGPDVTPEQLEDVRSAFAAANIEITVLSCYQDLSNPNAEVRRSAVSSVFSALKCQVTLGAGQVGSESACRDLSPEEKAATLPLLTDSILRIVEQAAQIGGCFALEPVYTHTLGTLEALQKLKETVADPQHFHIIFDPVNVLTADTAAHQAEFWPGWCEVIGKDLACIHMKDALFVPNAPRIPTPLGEGQMDYTILRDWLHREHPDAALLRDEVILSAAQRDLNFIRAM